MSGVARALFHADRLHQQGDLGGMCRGERRLSGPVRYEAARKGWGPDHSPNTAVWMTRPLSWRHTCCW